jgi:cytochrome c peroxidase
MTSDRPSLLSLGRIFDPSPAESDRDPSNVAGPSRQHRFWRRPDPDKAPRRTGQSSALAGLTLASLLSGPWDSALADGARGSAAALAGETEHFRKIGKLFRDQDKGTQETPAVIPQFEIDRDPSGFIASFQPNGPTRTSTNAFFQVLGTNGRSCFTCHQPQDGWTISARSVRERFRDDPTEPLFRVVDGANCPSDDISTRRAKRRAFSLLLDKADIRSGIALPQTREFEILSIDDPYNCTTNPTTGLSAIPTTAGTTGAVSLYRRPLPTTNVGFLTTLLWDGREPDLFSLSLHATRNRLQSTTDPTPAELQQMVMFQGCDFKNQEHRANIANPPTTSICAQTPPGSGIFTAQLIDDAAGYLNAAGGRGGPRAVFNDLLAGWLPPFPAFFFGINDPFGLNPTGAPFRPDVFHLYDAWEDLRGHDHITEFREQIEGGQEVFNNTVIQITGVAGINDATGQPVFPGACATCHDTPSVGNHSVPAPLNIGTANAGANRPPVLDISGLPVFTVVCTAGSNVLASVGQPFQVTDIGRAMISGNCADIGKFKGPILRGLASRAPYFHNGGAATLLDVVNFYNERFDIGFTPQQKADLVAFLSSL